MRTKILIVEDDASILNLLKISIGAQGYECTGAGDGEAAANLLENGSFDLVLLDIMLPKADGYELLSYIQPTGTPVIFLTAKASVEDRIAGLKMGADDYIVKPFQIGEVLARIETVLRRRHQPSRAPVQIGDVVVDEQSRTVRKGGEPVALTGKEFDLLLTFLSNPNIALYRQQLYERVWNEPFGGNTRTLDSHVQRLRKKLDWESRICTVFRIGYRLEV